VALVERSEALNRTNGLPQVASSPSASNGSSLFAAGVDWGDFGTGAAGALGLVLLAGGLAAASRHGRRLRAHA